MKRQDARLAESLYHDYLYLYLTYFPLVYDPQ